MILPFRCSETKKLFEDKPVKAFNAFERPARRKLLMLHQAKTIQDLLVPPGNRLEAPKGNRKGQHSIRINDQWRLCFIWTEQGPEQVEIVDYH